MNAKERVMASLKGETVDRRPFVPIPCMYGARLINAPLERYYREPALYAAGQAAIVRSFQPDILFSPLFFTGEASAFGAKLKYYEDQPPNIYQFPVSSAEEFLEIDFPDLDSHPALLYIRESLRLVVDHWGRDIPVGAILLNPVDLPSMVMGMDAWLDTLLFRRELVPAVCGRAIDYFVSMGTSLLGDGASFLVSSAGFLSSTVVSRDIVETQIMPVLEKAFAQINGPIVIHNGGASILQFMDLYRGLPNVVAQYADAGDDLAEARRKAGNSMALVGGMDGPTLDQYTPEEIYQRCVKVLKDRMGDPHFMLGTTGPDIPLDTPPDNIMAMLQAIQKNRGNMIGTCTFTEVA